MRAKKRLRVILDLIDKKRFTVADVGTDHGFLAKMLIDEERAKIVYATDVSEGSLNKAKDLAKNNNMENKIICLLGDGFKPISQCKLDYVVVAGLGGNEIIKILKETELSRNVKYIFQPVQNAVELRIFLNENSFNIKKDFIVEDKNKFYNTLLVEKCDKKQNLSYAQIELGLTNIDLPGLDFIKYLDVMVNKYESIISNSEIVSIQKKIDLIKWVKQNIKERDF